MNLKDVLRVSASFIAAAALTISSSPIIKNGMLIQSAALSFSDVKKGAYYEEPVNWAVEQNITTGTTATLFSPDKDCTLEQILTFLWRYEGKPDPAPGNPFLNIPSSNFYIKALTWAHEKALISGTSFELERPCTRGQAVIFLWQQAGKPIRDEAVFADVPAGSDCAKAVAWAIDNGITNGTGANTFSPDSTCTRGQIVTFLWRAAEAAANTQHDNTGFKPGTWLALNGTGYRYIQFSPDNTTGAIVSPADNSNTVFAYILENSNAVFRTDAGKDIKATVAHDSENTITIKWEDGKTEKLSYISKNIGDKFSYYTDMELCELALDYHESHGESDDPETAEAAEAAEAETNLGDGSVVIKLYGAHGGYDAPIATYTVNRITGKGTGRNGAVIDLTDI